MRVLGSLIVVVGFKVSAWLTFLRAGLSGVYCVTLSPETTSCLEAQGLDDDERHIPGPTCRPSSTRAPESAPDAVRSISLPPIPDGFPSPPLTTVCKGFARRFRPSVCVAGRS